jgi:hypothetical protein
MEDAMSTLPPVQFDGIPSSIDGFVALRNQVASTPQGGAAMMVVALLAYVEDEELGRQCLAVAVDRGRLSEGPKGYKGWQLNNRDLQFLRNQLSGKAYLPRSYIQGTSPENGYELVAAPYAVECTDNQYSGGVDSGTYKVFVMCSGAATPRPVTVKANDKGIWKAFEWSSLLVGVQPPAKQVSDDL